MPVGGRPHRRLLLALHHQAPARGLELPGAGAALLDHRLAAARGDLGREEDRPTLLVPEVPLFEADHQVGPIVRRLRRAFRVAQHPLGAGHAPTRAVEDLEAILQHQAGHVAPEAHAHGIDEKRGAGRRQGQRDPDERDGRPARRGGRNPRPARPCQWKYTAMPGSRFSRMASRSDASARTLPGRT